MKTIFNILFPKRREKFIFDSYDPELDMYRIKNETMNRMNNEINKINREAFTSMVHRNQDYINAVIGKNQHELPIDRHTEALMYSCIRDIQSMSYGSGLVRAPKFGMKHIKH